MRPKEAAVRAALRVARQTDPVEAPEAFEYALGQRGYRITAVPIESPNPVEGAVAEAVALEASLDQAAKRAQKLTALLGGIARQG